MKSTQIILAALLVTLPFISSTQTLEIHYDMQSQKVKYVYAGDTIARPKVKRGSDILLFVKNYNNYLYEVDVKANKSEIVVPEMENTSLVKRIADQAAALKESNAASGLLDEDFLDKGLDDEETEGGRDISDKESGGALFKPVEEIEFGASHTTGDMSLVQELKQIKAEYLTTRDQLALVQNKLQTTLLDINQELKSTHVNGIALLEIQKLKENPDLLPADIKQISTEYLQTVFNVSNIDEVDLKYVLERGDLKDVLEKKVLEIKQQQKEHLTLTQVMKRLNNLASAIGNPHSDIKSLQFSIDDTYTKAQLTQQSIASKVPEYEKQIEKVQSEDIQNLATLWYEYKAIAGNTFTKKYRTAANGDNISFDLSFITKKDSTKFDTAPIQVPVFGGFKINASAGISFGQFFDRPENYFVRDDIIHAEDQSSFYPFITSFVHFYAQGAKNVSVGGSVGVGFPLTSDNNKQSVTFFAGPSLIIGKGDRVVLSAGIMGGSVDRLGQAYEVGDSYVSEANVVPLSRRNELGFFAGLSYNFTSKK